MDTRTFIIRKTVFLLLGQLICVAIMCGIYWAIGRLDWSVLIGGAVGAVCAVANFFFMAMAANYAADRAQAQDAKGGKAVIKGSYIGRLVVLFAILFIFAKSGLADVLAMVIPLALIRPILMVTEFFRKAGDDAA